MSRCTSLPRSLLRLAAPLALVLVPGTAASDGSSSLPLPVNQGCFGLASYGIPMHGTGAGSVTLAPPGPILGAYLHWVGVDDETPPGVGQSRLTVNGVPVDGIPTAPPGDVATRPNPDWYSWWANIGPAGPPFFGLGLVADANRVVDVSDWDTSASFPATNGAAVTVVYDTGACSVPSTIEILTGVDWYFHGHGGDEYSELMVFAFPALPADRVVSFQVSHAGTDAGQNSCRGGAIWMRAGTGAAPGPSDYDLLDRDGSGRGFGINGGVEIVNDPFTSTALPCVPELNPPPDASYEPGHPCPGGADASCPYRALALRPLDGGDLGPEWGVIEVDVLVPLGSTWAVFQLESEADQDGESGSWAGSGLVLAELPLCGDGVLQPGEDCDDGSHCSDGTPCVDQLECANIGDQLCAPRDGDGCPADCRLDDVAQQCPVEIRCNDRQQCNDPGVCEAAVSCDPGVAVVCSGEQQVQVACDPAGPYAVGNHQVQVSASTPSQQAETVCSLEVRDCEPPSCQAPPELVLECSAACGLPADDPELRAWLDGFSSDDNCAIDATRLLLPSRLPAGCGQGERTEVGYLARDAAGYQAFCSTAVSVVDSLPPSIECPPPLTIDCRDPDGVAIDDPVIQAWLASASASDVCGSVELGNDAPTLLPSGCGAGETTSVTFTAVDDCGNRASCSSEVTVVDPPPSIESCGDQSVCLWPPNHKYVCFESFSSRIQVVDACGTGSVELEIECDSNQCDDAPCPEYPGQNGDGNTSDDCWYDPINDVLCARSERAGSDPEGRVYSVTVVARDDCGDSDPQTVLTVHVPHDQSEHDACLAPPPQAPR